MGGWVNGSGDGCWGGSVCRRYSSGWKSGELGGKSVGETTSESEIKWIRRWMSGRVGR